MRISGIDFPKPLLDALRDSNLVVFAGAGVSIGEPAGLPDFRKLAIAVSEGTGEVLAKGAPEDGFLGRLQDKGVDVHTRAAERLTRHDSKPSGLHDDLLRLYSTEQSVRLVTTNFDLLFERAADTIFDAVPTIFRAPALPRGTNFNGIIHIHGSTEQPSEMVLTDKDFGRAYLTEGWALRFLIDLFRSYTVLFVGYSHDDVVMNYLARALSPGDIKRRFALTENAGSERWGTLNIAPVIFDKPTCNDYQALYDGVSGLAKYVRRGTLDWRREIAEIAAGPPSMDEEAMDLIGEALSDPTHTEFFTSAASDPEWIDWLNQNGFLDKLFKGGQPGELLDQERRLAGWLAERFARDAADQLFSLMSRRGTRLHPDFWTALGDAVGRNTSPPLTVEDLTRWTSLLLSQDPAIAGNRILPMLGHRCVEYGIVSGVLDVFDAMAAFTLELRPGISMPEANVDVKFIPETVISYQYRELDWLWRKGLKPNLGVVAETLLSAMVLNLDGQHSALRSWQWADRSGDPLSFRRHAVEPHEQDRYPESVDVVIDVARDCLEYLAVERPRVAATWCDRLVQADAPLLRRLAVHTLSVRQDLTADEKVEWILASIGLHDITAHHETFQTIRAIYPSVGHDHRQTLVDAILAFTSINSKGESEERNAAYRHFEWFNWLLKADSDCNIARKALENVVRRYPDFKSREHPDLTHWTTHGGRATTPVPWGVDELLSEPAREWIERLSYSDEDAFNLDRYDLLSKVREAASRDFEWGLELTDALATSGTWETDLWPSLIGAWESELDVDRHRQVLVRLDQPDLHSAHPRSVSNALHALVKDGGVTYAAALLKEANQVAIALWDSLEQEEPSEEADWFNRALDHPAGILTQYWLESLSLSIQRQGTKPESLGSEYSPILSRVVQNLSLPGRIGKAVLASQLSFLADVDEPWVTENLIPLFEDTGGPDYQPVWYGLLWGILRPQTASMLESAFIRALECMDKLFPVGGGQRRQFTRAYTDMVTYFVQDPLTSWMPRFFEKANSEDRYFLAWHVGRNLSGMNETQRQEWWNRWLKDYWLNRCQGGPAPLKGPEVEAMLEWLPYLEKLYPSAVECAIRMPNTPLEHGTIIREIRDGKLWYEYPEPTAKLLLYLSKSDSSNWVWYGGTDLIDKLLNSELDKGLRTELEEFKTSLKL